jgi:hypothetical protein
LDISHHWDECVRELLVRSTLNGLCQDMPQHLMTMIFRRESYI